MRNVLLGAVVAVALSCDEALPPRVHPSDIDAREYLNQSFEASGGVVIYERSDTSTRSNAGTTYLYVENIHDEVLSGREDITIEVDFWLRDFPAETLQVLGDRDNLRNPFNFQGDVFMLDGEILTIHPDSTAVFEIGWDHNSARFWEYANPIYSYDSCFFPPCQERITTNELRMSARARVRLFEAQTQWLVTDTVNFTISYFFVVKSFAFVRLEAIEAWVDSSGPTIRWVTSYQRSVHQYAVQKSQTETTGFQTISNGLVSPQGLPADTVEYLVADPEADSGKWYYRIALLEYFNPAGVFMIRFLGPLEVVVP